MAHLRLYLSVAEQMTSIKKIKKNPFHPNCAFYYCISVFSLKWNCVVSKIFTPQKPQTEDRRWIKLSEFSECARCGVLCVYFKIMRKRNHKHLNTKRNPNRLTIRWLTDTMCALCNQYVKWFSFFIEWKCFMSILIICIYV